MTESVSTQDPNVGEVADEFNAMFEDIQFTYENPEAKPEKRKTKMKNGKKKTTKKKETKVVDLPWAQSLSTIPSNEETEFTEFDKQVYKFQPVIAEDERGIHNTGYYNVLCKIIDGSDPKEEWKPLVNGLLSKQYVVANLEGYIEEAGLKFEGEPTIFSSTPFMISVRGRLKTEDINVFDNDTAKTLFSLFSGTDIKTLDSLDTRLETQCINSYNGTRSLTRDFVLSFEAKHGEQTISFRDYFSLFELNHEVEHTSKIGIDEEMINIQERINSSISKLKKVTDVDKFKDELVKKLPKEPGRLLNRFWGGLVEEFKNLYYLLVLTSVALDQDYSLVKHCSIRSLVSRYVKEILDKK